MFGCHKRDNTKFKQAVQKYRRLYKLNYLIDYHLTWYDDKRTNRKKKRLLAGTKSLLQTY